MSELTAKQRRVVDAAKAAVTGGGWETLNPTTVRWSRTVETPEWARTYWTPETHPQHVFVTMMFGARRPVVLLRVCNAPWVEARDETITMDQALATLRDPAAELSARQPVPKEGDR